MAFCPTTLLLLLSLSLWKINALSARVPTQKSLRFSENLEISVCCSSAERDFLMKRYTRRGSLTDLALMGCIECLDYSLIDSISRVCVMCEGRSILRGGRVYRPLVLLLLSLAFSRILQAHRWWWSTWNERAMNVDGIDMRCLKTWSFCHTHTYTTIFRLDLFKIQLQREREFDGRINQIKSIQSINMECVWERERVRERRNAKERERLGETEWHRECVWEGR